jgi:hypothetical protein
MFAMSKVMGSTDYSSLRASLISIQNDTRVASPHYVKHMRTNSITCRPDFRQLGDCYT